MSGYSGDPRYKGVERSPQPLSMYAQTIAGPIRGLLETFAPGSSDYAAARDSILYGQEMASALRSGRWGDAVGNGLLSFAAGLGALPMVPSVVGMTRKLKWASGWPDGVVTFERPTRAGLARAEEAKRMLAAGADEADIFARTGFALTADGELLGFSKPARRTRRSPAEKLAQRLEDQGFQVSRKGSGLSASEYVEARLYNEATDEALDLKFRFSDHNLPPTYGVNHGYADYEIGPHSDAHGSSWREALDYALRRKRGLLGE